MNDLECPHCEEEITDDPFADLAEGVNFIECASCGETVEVTKITTTRFIVREVEE